MEFQIILTSPLWELKVKTSNYHNQFIENNLV